jgi:hypothetical protein
MDSDTKTGLSKTWTKAFPTARFYQKKAEKFAIREDRLQELKVNILHLSPPCQYYCRSHSTPGENDENNRFQIFFTGALLTKATLHIAVLEETAGLLDKKHEFAFSRLLLCFTQLGFSISWELGSIPRSWSSSKPISIIDSRLLVHLSSLFPPLMATSADAIAPTSVRARVSLNYQR